MSMKFTLITQTLCLVTPLGCHRISSSCCVIGTNTYRNLILFGARNRSRFILEMHNYLTVFDEMSKLAWENSRHLATNLRRRNERRNSILMTRHYPDLSSASDWPCRVGNLIQPIRGTTQIWVSQPSFGEETSFVSDKAENRSNERKGNENNNDEEKERRHKRKNQWWHSGLVLYR